MSIEKYLTIIGIQDDFRILRFCERYSIGDWIVGEITTRSADSINKWFYTRIYQIKSSKKSARIIQTLFQEYQERVSLSSNEKW